MARQPGFGLARSGAALAMILVALGLFLVYVRPGGSGGAAVATTPLTAPESVATPSPTAGTAATPTARATAALGTPAPPSDGIDPNVVAFTNPDGRSPDSFPADDYPFIEMAHALPTFGQLWIDDNQRDVHIGLTGDIEGAIEALRDGVPRGITVYFHVVEHTQEELCALRDRIFGDRDQLMRLGIVLMSGGCGNLEHRVGIGMSPLNPESIAFMKARYPGPVDYSGVGRAFLRAYEAPEPASVRITAVDEDYYGGLLTCGGRPFPGDALSATPTDTAADAPHVAALREALAIYGELYGDLSALSWVLVERDEYGATFIADRGDTLLEAAVYASVGDWVPGTIDYCEPRGMTPGAGDVSVYLDPAYRAPTADSTELHVLIEERACSGGSSPASRLLPPITRSTVAALRISVSVREVEGGATCPGNPRLPVTIVLPEPLGDRELRGLSVASDY